MTQSPKKVKVLHLITSLGGGGAERQLSYLCQDSNPSVTHQVVSLTEGGDLLPLFQKTGTYLGSLGMMPGRPSLKALIRLCCLLKKYQPDVVQTWLYHADLMGLVASKVMGIPRIYWNIRCSDMNLDQYSWVTRAIVWVNAKLSRYLAGILFNSYAGKQAHQALGFSPKQWHYMPNGFSLPEGEEDVAAVSFDDFQKKTSRKRGLMRERLGLPEDALVLGMVARVDPMKDHQTLLAATASLQKKISNVHLVLIGKGTETYEKIFRMDPLKGDSSRLHCLGFQKDASELMNAFDGLVLASRFGEGFPNVIGEAMARGIPVFSSNVGDARLIIKDDRHLFPIGEVQALQNLLEDFLTKQAIARHRLGYAFYQRIRENYSLKIMMSNYRSFYNIPLHREGE